MDNAEERLIMWDIFHGRLNGKCIHSQGDFVAMFHDWSHVFIGKVSDQLISHAGAASSSWYVKFAIMSERIMGTLGISRT